MPSVQLQNPFSYIVQKIPIVGNRDYSTVVFVKVLFMEIPQGLIPSSMIVFP